MSAGTFHGAAAALRASVDAAVAAVAVPGGAESAAVQQAVALGVATIDDLKRQAPLSVLVMTDGSFRHVPKAGAARVSASLGEVSLKTSADGRDRGSYTRQSLL